MRRFHNIPQDEVCSDSRLEPKPLLSLKRLVSIGFTMYRHIQNIESIIIIAYRIIYIYRYTIWYNQYSLPANHVKMPWAFQQGTHGLSLWPNSFVENQAMYSGASIRVISFVSTSVGSIRRLGVSLRWTNWHKNWHVRFFQATIFQQLTLIVRAEMGKIQVLPCDEQI